VQSCPIVDDVLSETEPCETNQAFQDWKAEVDAANLKYIALLNADRRNANARAKARSARR
jgi:hypothetical protein